MTFVHPGLAVAAAASALVPALIHLINRRRYRRVRWAAMGFLLAANRRSLRRIRFEQWILLLIRTAVIVLLGLALARPFLPDSALVGLGDTMRHRILLIDNSLSASVKTSDAGGAASRPPAAEAAMKLLSCFPRADAVSVVTLAAPAQALVGDAAFDRRMVRQRLGAIGATQGSTDLPGGLRAALKLLEDSPATPQNRVVYLIGDQAASAWQADAVTQSTRTNPAFSAARRIAEAASLVIVPTAPEPRDNLAVTALACTERLPATHQPIRLRATVTNFGRTPTRDVALQVRRDGRIVRRLPLETIGPGESVETTFAVVADSPGQHSVKVRLDTADPDILPADDARHLSLEVLESVSILLVDGQPGPDRFSGETGYLAAALAPGAASGNAGQRNLLAPKTITELELPGEVLAAYRLIVLCNVQRLDEGTWERLQGFVSGGGGLLVFTGEAISRHNYNRFGYAEGEGLLPGELGSPTGDAADRDTFVRFAPGAFTHPAMVDFADTDQSGLFLKGRIYRLVPVDPHPAAATVLLSYSNHLPAILERSFGRGKVCLVTTTANMSWNNLAARGDYVSLVWSLVSFLSPDSAGPRNLKVGDDIVQSLTAAQASRPLRVTTPDGKAADAALELSGSGYELRFGPLETAGVYRVGTGGESTVFAANIAPAESDLRVLDEPALRQLVDAPLAYLGKVDEFSRAGAESGSAEAARLLQYLVLLLLVCEAWLAMRFSSRR